MPREKATLTLDRAKVATAKTLVGARSTSALVDLALDRLIHAEQLRRDVAAYARDPLTAAELGVGDLPVDLDLGDAEVDYDKLYGKRR